MSDNFFLLLLHEPDGFTRPCFIFHLPVPEAKVSTPLNVTYGAVDEIVMCERVDRGRG